MEKYRKYGHVLAKPLPVTQIEEKLRYREGRGTGVWWVKAALTTGK
jgi:hypothetical protein